ncbi:uncharacterized protein LOC111614793 [Centruroides sculpturatus]|uniref:uncharacterized protein LOC111614793 n=1 Tax=Centruroides sculpturatus TaxID=218467 RepID=UPI000C6ED755|nr:uncharacterized protein LOC111614793 [Centruroides sculpturatus]
MNYYKTKNAYMKSLLWSERSKDFPLKDYFVQLTVQEADLLGKKEGETIQFTQIFPKSIDRHVVMLVTGDPGYGKTTFCKKIAYDWGTDTSRTNYLGYYDFTVVIILRELEKKSITDEILQCICENTDTNSRDKLRQRGFNLLIILDGFDETGDKDSIIQFIKKDSFHISKEITILVTCRLHAAENIREYINMRFIIQGFSQEQKENGALRFINPILHYSMYNFFKNVEIPAVIPKDLELKLHKTSKNLVALLSKDDLIGEVKYLISTKQYLSLKDNIKLSPDDK